MYSIISHSNAPLPCPTSLLPCIHSSDHSVFRLVCRVYASIADVLGYMAGEGGGIRAGPASNVAWGRAFALLDATVKVCMRAACTPCTHTHSHSVRTS